MDIKVHVLIKLLTNYQLKPYNIKLNKIINFAKKDFCLITWACTSCTSINDKHWVKKSRNVVDS